MRFDALVFGSETVSFPFMRQICLVMCSSPVSKFRSLHHFSRFFGRQSAAVGWVALEQAILYSLLQRTAAAEMAVPHGAVG